MSCAAEKNTSLGRPLAARLAVHFAIGATLGAALGAYIIHFNIGHVAELIGSPFDPGDTIIVIMISLIMNCAIGATLTGLALEIEKL